jgi:tRNA threonylcarbamoyladenosine biosynthesis protein TsaE
MDIRIASMKGLQGAAEKFIAAIGDSRVIAFYGRMGAGKTTFIKTLCSVLGVRDQVNSPTFAIVNEYTSGQAEPIFHFDFYRIKSINEAYDFGYEDYFYSGHFCLIEWPELIEPILPENVLKVNIIANDDESRIISF